MGSSGSGWESIRVGDPSFTIEAARSQRGSTCSCGTRIHSGGPVIRVTKFPAVASALFHDFEFHGPTCLNAYILEGLAVLEAVDASEAARVCRDLRDLILALRAAHSQFVGAGFV